LKNDPELISECKKLHAPGSAWPEVTLGMNAVGIRNMEIHLSGTTLFMIMDTVLEFDYDNAMSGLPNLPRQAGREAVVSGYRKTNAGASAGDKRKLTKKVFKFGE
jgi:L-rhamnose mutarotase